MVLASLIALLAAATTMLSCAATQTRASTDTMGPWPPAWTGQATIPTHFSSSSSSSSSSSGNATNAVGGASAADLSPAGGRLVDSCPGRSQAACAPPTCIWTLKPYPWCFTLALFQRAPSPVVDVSSSLGLAMTMFNHAFGVYLSEGTWTKLFYNVDIDDCAALALSAANQPGKRRALGFNFFPFESPLYSAPWSETTRQGMCQLLTSNRDSGRLRNEDEGFTDAELFYTSHFSHRPFSGLAGYYELRDPRGGMLSYLLGYDASKSQRGVSSSVLWPRSRWGLFHLSAPESVLVSSNKTWCTGNAVNPGPPRSNAGAVFTGGFTPVNDDAQCTGPVTKSDAATYCAQAGGTLCTQRQLAGLVGRQIGCSLDNYPVWSIDDADDDGTTTKYARCCATYVAPLDCSAYTDPSRVSFCTEMDLTTCINRGSGTSAQINGGYGHLLSVYRQSCALGKIPCRNAVVSDWAPCDKCIWCPSAGGSQRGQCRPGTHFGVCAGAPDNLRDVFASTLRATCGLSAMCTLPRYFVDWRGL